MPVYVYRDNESVRSDRAKRERVALSSFMWQVIDSTYKEAHVYVLYRVFS